MERYYKEKALLATENKIHTLKKNSNLIPKNIVKVILFGIGFSLYAPFFGSGKSYGRNKNSVMSLAAKNGISYLELVLYIIFGYFICCILLHYLWEFQDKSQLKKLFLRKQNLEKELEELK